MAFQDGVFMRPGYTAPTYQLRRNNLCIVAINCGQAGGTCFCTSMHTGPKATAGFDLALTEVLGADRHYFVVEVGTELGTELLHELPHTEANKDDIQLAADIVASTAAHMGRSMETTNLQHSHNRNV